MDNHSTSTAAQNKENIANGTQDKSLAFEIVNEDYKAPGITESTHKDDHKDNKDDRDKKKKKKHKKKDRRDDESDEDPGPSKKVKSSVLDNKNIPEGLRQKCYETEKNPLAVAIGNIPLGASKTELLTFFTTLLTSLRPDFVNPIRDIEIGSTKNFAIMELDTKDIRDYTLSLENLELKGYKLQIKKVKGFFNKIYDAEAAGVDLFGNFSTGGKTEEGKLYIGGIPLYLKEDDIRKICEAFGFLKFFNCVKDHEGNHKGYCFIEYLDPKATEKALKGLEGLEIGDKKLRVQRATALNNTPKIPAAQSVASGAKPTNAGGSFLMGFPNISDLNVQSMLNTPISSKTPSRVIQILNVCTPEDLLEDDFYNDLMEDMKEETSKFGNTEEVNIPRPDLTTGIIGPSVGKVFVKYVSLISAKQARHRLAGRSYNKRTIVTAFYPEDKYDSQEYLKSAF